MKRNKSEITRLISYCFRYQKVQPVKIKGSAPAADQSGRFVAVTAGRCRGCAWNKAASKNFKSSNKVSLFEMRVSPNLHISSDRHTSTRAPRGNGSRVNLIALFIRLDGKETEKRPLRRNEPAARRLICMPAPMNDRRNDPFLFFYALDRRKEKDFKQNNRNHSVLTFSLIFLIFLIFFSYFYSPLRRVALLFRAFTSSKNFDDVIKTRPEAAVRVRSEFTEKKIYTKGIGSKQSSASKCDPIAREKVDVPEFFAIKNK